jgi:predicted small metal-binding protein
LKLNMTCKHCGEVIGADDEDELVSQVQAHARSHDGGPELSREHIQARLHRLERREPHEP